MPVSYLETAISLSLDHTFKAAAKGTVTASQKTAHLKLWKGGILSIINESNEIVAWVSTHLASHQVLIASLGQCFCQSQAGAEIAEVLEGIKC
jgi:hypothetical protein